MKAITACCSSNSFSIAESVYEEKKFQADTKLSQGLPEWGRVGKHGTEEGGETVYLLASHAGAVGQEVEHPGIKTLLSYKESRKQQRRTA